MAAPDRSFTVLGVITGAHGIRGEVKLKSFTGEPEAVGSYGPLETRDGRSFEITGLKPAKAGFVARIKGIGDRNQAEALKGTELGLPRHRLPEPEPEEFYHQDLIGLSAETADGEPYGEVVAVHDFGAGDLLEVRHEGVKATELIPFTKAAVPEVDLQARKVVVVPPKETEDEDEGT
jgi:16S rRNA processing protein RimM